MVSAKNWPRLFTARDLGGKLATETLGRCDLIPIQPVQTRLSLTCLLTYAMLSLCGREVVPSVGFDSVLWNALASGVHHSEIKLGHRFPLLGRHAEPTHRLAVVLGNALSHVGT